MLRCFVSKGVRRRALLVFADEIHRDLARRAFPNAARPLFNVDALSHDISAAVDVHIFTSGNSEPAPAVSVHRQIGRNFSARLENAIETVARLGYDEVVAIGRDCPALCGGDIESAFAGLKFSKLVLGPDHRGGCYLIAFRSADRALLRDVRWKRNTDCAELVERGGTGHVFLLPVKQDLDSWTDLRIFARTADPRAYLAAFLLSLVRPVQARLVRFVSIVSQEMRVRQQMPPPAFLA
jgi:glycosyltransferase A (GT-A) superfamily protein (DUF2064 family)